MKRPFLICLIVGIFAFASYSQFGIVVNKLLYDANSNVRTSITNYMNALKNNDGQTTVWLYEYDFSSSNNFVNPSVLRQVLINHYNSDSPKLQGVVFVGDLPYVITTDLNNREPNMHGPTESYFMDMDGAWTTWTTPSTPIIRSTPNNNISEIWVSRIPTNHLTMLKDASGNTMTEAAIATQYFNKVVARMTQPSNVPYDMACFTSTDADLNPYPGQFDWQSWFLYPSGLGFPQSATTMYEWNGWVDYVSLGIRESWIRELQKGHTIIQTYWHGSSNFCHIQDYEFVGMYPQPSKVLFFLLNSCITGNYIPPPSISENCIAALYGIGQGGLIALAQTVTTDPAICYKYYTPLLSQGFSFGKALQQAGVGSDMFTLFGAGTLKMQPFVQPSGDVAAALSSNGDMYCFIRGSDNNMYFKVRSNGTSTWTNGWLPMGGPIQRNIAVGKDPDGSLYVFAVGTNNYLKYRKQSSAGSTTWNDWINLSSSIAINSPIATAQYANGQQAVFARSSSNNALYMLKQNTAGGAWASSWTLMNGTAIEDKIAVGKNSDGRLEAFVRNNSTKSVMNIWQNTANGSWNATYFYLAGPADGTIAVASNSNGPLELFVGTQKNLDMWHCWQVSGGGWSSWGQLIQNNFSGPFFAVGKNLDGRLEIFTFSYKGMFCHIWQSSPNSGPWVPTTPANMGLPSSAGFFNPAVINCTDGRLAVFEFSGTNIWCIEQAVPSGWGSWRKASNY